MSKLSFPERRRNLEADIAAAELAYDAAADAAAATKSHSAKSEKEMHGARLRDLKDDLASLGREEARADQQAEEQRQRDAKAAQEKSHAAAMAQIKVVRNLGTELSAAFKVAVDKQSEIFAELAKLQPLLTSALGRGPDGDISGMAITDVLKQVLVFRGLAPGFAEREEPNIQAAVDRILGNFAGQVQISARKRGLTLPA